MSLLIVGAITLAVAALAVSVSTGTNLSVAFLLAAASAFAVVMTARWWSAEAPGHRRPVFFLLVAAWLWWFGDLTWVLAAALGRTDDWSGIGRLPYIVSCICLAVSRYPSGKILRESSTRAVLDGLLIGLVVTFVVWSSSPDFPASAFDHLSVITGAANGVFVSFTLIQATQAERPERFHRWLLFAVAVMITAQYGADLGLATGWQWNRGDEVLVLGWGVASVLRGVAAWTGLRLCRPAKTLVTRELHPPGAWERVLPLVATGVGVFTILFTSNYSTGTVVLGVALVACLVARQIAADLEQRVLRRRLSTAAVELRTRAERDLLTGLYNRGPLIHAIRGALDPATAPGKTVGLLFLDVDHFKHINDRFGHTVGDLLLVGLARALGTVTEPGDIVSRLGGDEFIVLRPDLVGDSAAWAEQVRARLEVPIQVVGGVIRITVSIGVVAARPGSLSSDTLLARGDMALYRAKRAGRNRSAGPDPHDHPTPDLSRITHVLGALERRELAPHYQPIVSLRDESVVGMEALCRWIHRDGTVTEAPQFLPDLLAAGRASDITEVMLLAVCSDFATGIPAQRGWIASVNLSASELSNPSVIDQFARIMAVTGMPADRLQVEIDERTEPTGAVARVLTGLDRLGVRLVLDDFGAGWSTFGQLVRLAPVAVKLDRSLIDPAGVSDFSQPLAGSGRLAAQLLVDSFVQVSHHLGMSVVAEGIELPEQLEALRKLGCEYGQGYLWCRPKPLPEVLAWVDEHDRRIRNNCPGTPLIRKVAQVTDQ